MPNGKVDTERPTPKARATRARLLDTADAAFVGRGYGATSVRDLADGAAMTTGAIYGHFRGKADLLGEAVRRRLDEDLRDHGGRPYPESALADWVARTFTDYPTRRALRALLVEAAAASRVDREVRESLREVLESRLEEWAERYEEIWPREGLDPGIDPESAMRVLFALEVGLGIFEALGLELPAPPVVGGIVHRILRGFETSARPAPA